MGLLASYELEQIIQGLAGLAQVHTAALGSYPRLHRYRNTSLFFYQVEIDRKLDQDGLWYRQTRVRHNLKVVAPSLSPFFERIFS